MHMVSYQQGSKTRKQDSRGKPSERRRRFCRSGIILYGVETAGPKTYHTFDYGERINISVVMTSRSETGLGHVPTVMSNEGKVSRGVGAILGRLFVHTHNASAAGPPDVQVSCHRTQAPQKHFTNDIYERTHLCETLETRHSGGQYSCSERKLAHKRRVQLARV